MSAAREARGDTKMRQRVKCARVRRVQRRYAPGKAYARQRAMAKAAGKSASKVAGAKMPRGTRGRQQAPACPDPPSAAIVRKRQFVFQTATSTDPATRHDRHAR